MFWEKRHSVNPGHLLTIFISLPVSSATFMILTALMLLVSAMCGSFTKIDEVPLPYKRQGFISATLFNQLEFVVFVPFFLKKGQGFISGNGLSAVPVLLSCQLKHFLFNLGEIFLGNSVVPGINIIIKSGIRCRTSTKFDSRVQGFQGFCHQVG